MAEGEDSVKSCEIDFCLFQSANPEMTEALAIQGLLSTLGLMLLELLCVQTLKR